DRAGPNGNEPGTLQRAQEPAQVPRVESETRPQPPHLAPVLADLPQHPRLSKGPVSGEVMVVQGADAFAHGSVEGPHGCDDGIHIPDFSQRSAAAPPLIPVTLSMCLTPATTCRSSSASPETTFLAPSV